MPGSYYRIDLKDIPERYREESILKVLLGSPLPVKREVEKFAYYFRREGHFDFVQFAASDTEPYTAYLFASPEQTVWAGACCFRTQHFSDLDMDIESLHWVWLHPYFRSRGILKSHWAAFRKAHGDFYIEPPLSPAMREFLLKHGKGSVWYPLFEGKTPDVAGIKAKLICALQKNQS